MICNLIFRADSTFAVAFCPAICPSTANLSGAIKMSRRLENRAFFFTLCETRQQSAIPDCRCSHIRETLHSNPIVTPRFLFLCLPVAMLRLSQHRKRHLTEIVCQAVAAQDQYNVIHSMIGQSVSRRLDSLSCVLERNTKGATGCRKPGRPPSHHHPSRRTERMAISPSRAIHARYIWPISRGPPAKRA